MSLINLMRLIIKLIGYVPTARVAILDAWFFRSIAHTTLVLIEGPMVDSFQGVEHYIGHCTPTRDGEVKQNFESDQAVKLGRLETVKALNGCG